MHSPKKKITRQEAIKLGLKRYHGKPCKTCGTTEKQVSKATCHNCHKIASKKRAEKFRREHPEEAKARYRKWKLQNPDSHKSSMLKHNFGITLEDYKKMLKEQNDGCAICGRRKNNTIDPRTKKPRMLAVDHDHRTGKVRGLLCDLHNRGLGMFQDSVDLLQIAIHYLKKHGGIHNASKSKATIRRHKGKNRSSGERASGRKSSRH